MPLQLRYVLLCVVCAVITLLYDCRFWIYLVEFVSMDSQIYVLIQFYICGIANAWFEETKYEVPLCLFWYFVEIFYE